MELTRIKLCRFASGLLQTQLAKRAQMEWRRLADIESGQVRPHIDELDRIAAALGVPADGLVPSQPECDEANVERAA